MIIITYIFINVNFGWGAGIRTPECQDQNLVPYHLATPQRTRVVIYYWSRSYLANPSVAFLSDIVLVKSEAKEGGYAPTTVQTV
jgi:hypothetical protein